MIDIPNAPLDEWLAELKVYQKEQIKELLLMEEPLEVASLWLSANGATNTAGFGGSGGREPFFEQFREEFSKFVCGDPKYEDVRRQLKAEAHVTKSVLITLASAAIAVHLGIMESLIVPAIAIMLHSVGIVGVNTWCAGRKHNQP